MERERVWNWLCVCSGVALAIMLGIATNGCGTNNGMVAPQGDATQDTQCVGSDCPDTSAEEEANVETCLNCADAEIKDDTKPEDVVQTVCNNGVCEDGENCLNCIMDCGCVGNKKCGASGACVFETCGNGMCEAWEDCGCAEDCPCNNEQTCAFTEKTCGGYTGAETNTETACETSGEKVWACINPYCGDGKCYLFHYNNYYENCNVCPEDCPCENGTICHAGEYGNYSCVPTVCNNDGVCDSWENCNNCIKDCPCASGKECDAENKCVWTVPPTCGDGKCDAWENCGSCITDCPCPATTACDKETATCNYVCPADAVMPEICKYTAATKADSCPYGHCLFNPLKICATDADCQQLPPDKYPPCVCWSEMVCTMAAWGWCLNWETGGPRYQYKLQADGQYCQLDAYFPESPNPIGSYYYKPGSDHVQKPPEGRGQAEVIFSLSPDGSQGFISWPADGSSLTCDRMDLL